MRIQFIIAGVVLLVLYSVLLVITMRTPRNDRIWEHAFSRTPYFETLSAKDMVLREMRDFEFGKDGAPFKQQWVDQIINREDLAEIWFFIEPFESWDGAAHSFLSFVFDGETAQTISISVEARKEEGETYSGLRGAFNAYELIYQWSTEKDILSRIAVGLDHELYAYRLDITPEQTRIVFNHFVDRTNQLRNQPRFYNTLTSNCTNELAKAVNSAFPGALPWHYSHVLTGYAAEHLYARDLIDGAQSFSALKADAAIGDLVRAHSGADTAAFPKDWRQAVSRRSE
ncbi:DUF4105 domain-containing protein [Hyphococcus sp.]|uniref:lipoprotein N-acyltransferase Lnb domain-containing protein n=1 Tax=Hyphococcus sp. TaxID=2038636 RepID=UPI003CCBF45B